MRAWSIYTILFVSQLVLTVEARSLEESDYQGIFDRSNVLVVVEFDSGWHIGNFVAGLGCDGRFKIVGAYSDTTAIRTTVSPDSALAFVNDLSCDRFPWATYGVSR